jgi:hypothetical protein
MRERISRTRQYSLVLLKATTERGEPGADALVWEHGRRNFSLNADGRLPIVCPVLDDSGWAGIGIFDTTPDEATRIMDADPAVAAGLFTYEVHPVRGFPGSTLPG